MPCRFDTIKPTIALKILVCLCWLLVCFWGPIIYSKKTHTTDYRQMAAEGEFKRIFSQFINEVSVANPGK